MARGRNNKRCSPRRPSPQGASRGSFGHDAFNAERLEHELARTFQAARDSVAAQEQNVPGFEISLIGLEETFTMYNGREITGRHLQGEDVDEPWRFYAVRLNGRQLASFSTVESLDAVRRVDSTLDERLAGPFFQAEGQLLFLESVYVDPAARGQGAFTAIIDFLRAQGRPLYADFENEKLAAHFAREHTPAALLA